LPSLQMALLRCEGRGLKKLIEPILYLEN